jgi:hypothetical protein
MKRLLIAAGIVLVMTGLVDAERIVWKTTPVTVWQIMNESTSCDSPMSPPQDYSWQANGHYYYYHPGYVSEMDWDTRTDTTYVEGAEYYAQKVGALYGTPESIKEQVLQLAKSGEICKVLGHQWEDIPLIYPTNPPIHGRRCRICGIGN